MSTVGVPEASSILGIGEDAVRNMLNRGQIAGFRTGPVRGRWRIPVSEIDRLTTTSVPPAHKVVDEAVLIRVGEIVTSMLREEAAAEK